MTASVPLIRGFILMTRYSFIHMMRFIRISVLQDNDENDRNITIRTSIQNKIHLPLKCKIQILDILASWLNLPPISPLTVDHSKHFNTVTLLMDI